MSVDFLILRAGKNFRAGSAVSAELERELWLSLSSFLNAQKCVKSPIVVPDLEDMEGFELRSKSLSEKGLQLVKAGLDKWLKGIDRGKPPSDISILEKALAKIAD